MLKKLIRSCLAVCILVFVMCNVSFANDNGLEVKVIKFLDSRMKALDVSENKVSMTKFFEGYKQYFDFKDFRLKEFFNDYTQIKFDRYVRRGLSQRVVDLKEKIEVNEEFGLTKIMVSRLYEIEYSFDGVVDVNHSMEEVNYRFLFDGDKLVDYSSDDAEEMAYLNMPLNKIKRIEMEGDRALLELKEFAERENDIKLSDNNEIVPLATLSQLNRTAMYNYAKKHAYNYNSNYINLSGYGGDCANFASQIIRAGGSVFDTTGSYTWYYYGGSNRSSSWASATNLCNYLTGNDYIGPQGYEASSNESAHSMKVGDIIFLDFDGDGW